MPQKKDISFIYGTELVIFVYVCNYVTTGGKNQFWLDSIKDCKFPVMLQWLLLKVTFTVLCVQFCLSQNRIYCLSVNLVVSPYVASGLHDLLQDFFSRLQFLLVYLVLHVHPQEVVKGYEIWWPCRPGFGPQKVIQQLEEWWLRYSFPVGWHGCIVVMIQRF